MTSGPKGTTPPLVRPAVHATQSTTKILSALARRVDDSLNAQSAFAKSTHWAELPGSAAADERRLILRQYGPGTSRDWDARPIDYAVATAPMFTSVAAQHLEAIAELVKTKQVLFPLAPLVRSILEIGGHLHWMLCPIESEGWTIRDRAARVFLIELADRQHAFRAAKSLRHPNVQPIAVRYKKLRKRNLPDRFYPSEISVDPKTGAITLRGRHRVPGLRDSVLWIERVQGVDWDIGGAYDYLSNATHPTFSHVQELIQFNGQYTQFGLDDATFPYRLVRMGLFAFLATWQLTAAYLGYPQQEMKDLMNDFDTDPALLSVRN